MLICRFVFSPLMTDFLSTNVFDRSVQRYLAIDAQGLFFWDEVSPWRSQMTSCESLRYNETCQRSLKSNFYHTGFCGEVA